jgi:hypothetical protein
MTREGIIKRSVKKKETERIERAGKVWREEEGRVKKFLVVGCIA